MGSVSAVTCSVAESSHCNLVGKVEVSAHSVAMAVCTAMFAIGYSRLPLRAMAGAAHVRWRRPRAPRWPCSAVAVSGSLFVDRFVDA